MAWKISTDPRITAQALERQMRNWELGRSQHFERSGSHLREVEDFITLSREVGAPAGEVANKLGEILGWPVFGRNLLDTMAGDDVVRRRIYESLDQRDLKWWQEALYSLFGEGFVRNDYFRLLCETVLSLARQGNCIFVGRGCDRLLPEHLGLRVRLIAPVAERVEAFRQSHGLSSGDAKREIDRIEKDRAEFIQHHFGIEANDVGRHDLTLNLGRMTPVEASEVILAAHTIRQQVSDPGASPSRVLPGP